MGIETMSGRLQNRGANILQLHHVTTEASRLSCLQPDHGHFCPGLPAAHLQLQVLLHCSLTTGMQTWQ